MINDLWFDLTDMKSRENPLSPEFRQQSSSPTALHNTDYSYGYQYSPQTVPMESHCSSPDPCTFAVPSDNPSNGSHSSRKRELIPQRKQREFTPDTRKDDTYWDRRRRNNEAAKRSREKRRLNDMVLETRVMELTTENSWLKAELNAVREKCGIPKDAPPLINPGTVTSSAPPMPSYNNKDQYGVLMNSNSLLPHVRPSPVQVMPHFLGQSQNGRGLPVIRAMTSVHPSMLGNHPAMGHVFAGIPNQHMYVHPNMMPYGRMNCQSLSPLPRSSSSGSRSSPCASEGEGDPRENGGAVSPSIAAVSSLLKLANSHFNGFPHLPREEDSDTSSPTHRSAEIYDRSADRSAESYDYNGSISRTTSKSDEETYHGDSEGNNHLPLKLRHKTRMEASCSPPLNKSLPNSSNTSSHEEDVDGSGYSGEDSAVDVTECDDEVISRKRKSTDNADTATRRGPDLQSENVQLRGELQRLASEVANLKVMMKKPEPASPPPMKKQRKTRTRRS